MKVEIQSDNSTAHSSDGSVGSRTPNETHRYTFLGGTRTSSRRGAYSEKCAVEKMLRIQRDWLDSRFTLTRHSGANFTLFFYVKVDLGSSWCSHVEIWA